MISRVLLRITIPLLLITGCEVISTVYYNPELSVDFEVVQSNSDNDYNSSASRILTQVIKSDWRLWNNSTDSVTLIKELSFDVVLENDDTLDLGFWFIKYEDAAFLTLKEDSVSGKTWSYNDIEVERENFYKNFRESRVMINNNVIFHTEPNDYFQLIDVRKISVGGEKKTYIDLTYSGTLFGWYDPSGEYQEVYTLANGHLTGVVE